MHYVEKNESVVQEVFFPGNPIKVCDQEPDICIARMGEAWGSGSYSSTFLTPYYWGMLALQGEARVQTAGEKLILRAGDFLLIRPDEECRFEERSSAPFSYLWFDISGRLSHQLLQGFERSDALYFIRGGRRLESRLRELARQFKEENYSVASSVSCGWMLLEYLHEFARLKPEARSDIAFACRMIIDKRFGSNLSVAEIASGFGVNRVTLYRKFRERYGISPKEYLVDVRIEQACKLLRTTELPLKELAHECGFATQQQFYLLFKEKNGESPGRYRRGE